MKTKKQGIREYINDKLELLHDIPQCATIAEACLPDRGGKEFVEKCFLRDDSFIVYKKDDELVGFAIFESQGNYIRFKCIAVLPGRNVHFVVREMLEGFLAITAKHAIPVCADIPKGNMSLYVALGMLEFEPADIFSKKINGIDTEFYTLAHTVGCV